MLRSLFIGGGIEQRSGNRFLPNAANAAWRCLRLISPGGKRQRDCVPASLEKNPIRLCHRSFRRVLRRVLWLFAVYRDRSQRLCA